MSLVITLQGPNFFLPPMNDQVNSRIVYCFLFDRGGGGGGGGVLNVASVEVSIQTVKKCLRWPIPFPKLKNFQIFNFLIESFQD